MQIVTKGARQGDVMLISVGQIARLGDGRKKRERVSPEGERLIVARGESTGHHHSFGAGGRITLFRDETVGPFLVETTAPVALEHQEHDPIKIAPGKYHLIRQRVFQTGMTRRVED